jgi:hypothetical protein
MYLELLAIKRALMRIHIYALAFVGLLNVCTLLKMYCYLSISFAFAKVSATASSTFASFLIVSH